MRLNKENFIEIDGSQGEGGGQILRTSLSLSMITGKPLAIHNIRAKRKKPGLLRQHLTAVLASAQISNAHVDGAELSSQTLTFKPQAVQAGTYEFNIGSAGSTTLVLQTLLPTLLYADKVSQLTIKGGTHNPLAPPVDFLQTSWLPLLKRMGASITLKLDRYGFMPAGGGILRADISPSQLQPLFLKDRGEIKNRLAKALISDLPLHIAERELSRVQEQLNWPSQDTQLITIDRECGPGNILMLSMETEQLTQSFCVLGEVRKTAERVADDAINQAKFWLNSQAIADEYLADQLLLPMALAGGGSFTCSMLSEHLRSNAKVIQHFLPIQISYETLNKHCNKVILSKTRSQ